MNEFALNDIRVLDCSRVLAGPYCAMLLGDYGADVIKVEQPIVGDPTRQWGPPFQNGQSTYFQVCNRNKRSITIDIKQENGQDLIRKLAIESDIFIENFKTGYLKKYGLDYETLSSINPRLIYCSITGYGQTGPYKDEAGYDYIIQAQSGLMSITGTDQPVKLGVPIVDIVTGINACHSILAALYWRERSGTGQFIDCSLLDNSLSLLTNVAQGYFVAKEKPKRYGNAHPNIVPYQSVHCSDGLLAIAVGSDKQFLHLAELLNSQELLSDTFNTNEKRVNNRYKLIQVIERITMTQTIEYWLSGMIKLGIPAAKINSIPEIMEDPQVISRQIVQEINHPEIGRIKQLGHANKLSSTPATIRLAPPVLSEHSEEILRDLLHYTDREIKELRNLKII
ncbi:MAG: CoA transferase [Calditrichaeota bacterium]|nr:CoA transferase [Calditrichota bacterium]